MWNFDAVSHNIIGNNTAKNTVQNPIKSTVKSTVMRFCRKYCNVLIHCECLVDGTYGQELGQE